MVHKNVITWFEIPTKNFDRAMNFYGEILGIAFHVQDFMGKKMAFFPMEGKEGVGGALLAPDFGKGFEPGEQGVRIYLNCEGMIDEVLEKTEKAGGKISKGRLSIGENGFIAFIVDSEGNFIGLHSMK
ncbi:MAG: VOC family protein [Parcubacteria group bacterium]|nr:VOC family protein [Parcubacteria group bacterium]